MPSLVKGHVSFESLLVVVDRSQTWFDVDVLLFEDGVRGGIQKKL